MTTIIRPWHPGDPKPVGVTRLRIPRNAPPPFARRRLAAELDIACPRCHCTYTANEIHECAA